MSTDYATTTELKVRVSIEAASTASDTILQQLLDAAAYIIDSVARNPAGMNRLPPGAVAFTQTSSATRYFDDPLDGVIDIDDCLSVSAVARNDVTLDSQYYELWPFNRGTGPATRLLLRSDALLENTVLVAGSWYGYPQKGVGVKRMAITGTWGYCATADRPAVIKEATLTQAERLYERLSLSPSELVAGYRDPYKTIDPLAMAILGPVLYVPPPARYGLING